MRMHNVQLFGIGALFLVIGLCTVSCGEKKEAVKAPVVSKKIAASTDTMPAQPRLENPPADAAEAAEATPSSTETASVSRRIYDPSKRINPFTPLFGMKEESTGGDPGSKRKKRVPQTPLERISLDQLKLVAIVRASTGNRALVEDNIGKGYIIKNGTYIGLNAGMVTQINPESVIIEEEIENLKGELVLQRTEIKLQKPAGE